MDTGITTLTNGNGWTSSPASIESRNATSQFYWLFELEDDGTIIYSRPNSFGIMDGLKGQNFFEQQLGFEDISGCRHHFRSFIKSNKAAASFNWRRSSAGQSTEATVFMTRAHSTGFDSPTDVVMMEIRGR